MLLMDASPRSIGSSGYGTTTPLIWSWACVVLVPVFFFFSFIAAQGIYVLVGHDPSTGDVTPLWANLAAGIPGLAIALLPCIAGVVFARRALRAGHRSGIVPLALAALLGVGMTVLVIVNL
ncbi:MAG: hypothetical protein BGO37_02210 [Cellulomonas sp. 73-92]|nr:MAG: hypothetical protein BGO37_02210 [Cellulomonas sp. 73-92]